jgi:hypothetical protein
MPGPTAWAQGLSSDKQAEWLVDCYRMRLDDDYAIGGGWEVPACPTRLEGSGLSHSFCVW